ncbi:MAG: PAS domain S-box protein [Melioribacteraceae bacterium]|nr:PAS domain S-box protein [Melioribacteraceae bacterium]
MDIILLSYGIVSGLAIIILLLNFILAVKDFQKQLNYSIVAVGIGILSFFISNLCIYFAHDVNEIIFYAKVLDTSILLTSIAFIVYSYYYAGSLNKIVLVIPVLLAVFIIFIAISQPYGLMFQSVDMNLKWDGYWKAEYRDLNGIKSAWQDLLMIYSLLYLVFIIYASAKIFQEKRYSEGIQYLFSIIIIVVATLVDEYVYNFHEEFAFVLLLILMSLRLVGKLINAYSFEKAFNNSEEKYKRLIENSALGIYQSTFDGRIIMLNSSGKKILGLSENDEINKTNYANDIFQNLQDRETFKSVLLLNRNIYNYEVELKKLDGEKIFVREHARLIKNNNGEIIIEGSFEDITEKKNAVLLLIKAKEEAEKSDRLKTEFLAQMSHEIRTPINTIINYSQLLKYDWELKEFESSNSYFNSIANASKRMIRTIDLILNMSQYQTKTYNVNYQNIELNTEIIQKLVKEFSPEAKANSLKLSYDTDMDNAMVYCDEYTVTQIFDNLIDNAIKFTKKGSIKIVLKTKADKIFVEVEDSGIGISNEYQKNLFQPFSQGEQGYTRQYDGNGLGLALVKNYCDLNKAKISVESKEGKGTKFVVQFDKIEAAKLN